jgi:glycosyltransferase involved in cell wall biosynthesis
MKQVWVLNHYAQEPSGVGGTRHFHLADHLRAFDWQATIIAGSVELQSGRQRLESGETIRLENFSGIPFLWVRTPKYTGNGVGRMLNMLGYTWMVLRPSTTKTLHPPDVIIGSSVHPFAAAAGALLARRFKVPFVFEVRDLWPQTLIDMGTLAEDSFITWLLRQLEQWLYRRAAKIVVLLPLAWKYITQIGIPKERVVWIPNGVDLSLFPRIDPELHCESETFTLMYFGAHGQANGLDNILAAMKLVLKHSDGQCVHLRMIGDGPLKSELVDYALDHGLTNVSFETSVPKNQIPKLAAQADAFVISVVNLPGLYRFGISMNKLFDYLAASRPVIIAADSANNPVAEANAGLTVPPENPEALANAILKMASLPASERMRLGISGRTHVEENYGFQRLAAKLAAVLNDV